MLIILENNQITAIEKNLLNELGTDLISLSELIHTLNLQLSSIQNTPIRINKKEFSVKEIEILSTKNIKVFDLISKAKEESAYSEEKISNNIFKTDETKTQEEHIQEPILINEEEKAEDFLAIGQIKPEEPQPIEIGIIKEKDKEPEKTKPQPEEKLINLEEEKIELEHPKAEKITNINPSKPNIPEIIEISFEDDLEEIRNILNMNKEKFSKAVTSELKKASEELGIDYNELVKWYNQLIEQIKDEKTLIDKYINKKDYKNLHESYHKLKGAALNLRLSQIALVLKKLDELSKNKEDIEKIKHITEEFYNLIENDAVSLTEKNESSNQQQSDGNSDKYKVEDIIIKTIQSYLNTQNEAQFQKDKKYIEKLLNTKIDSIENLQQIIKGMK